MLIALAYALPNRRRIAIIPVPRSSLLPVLLSPHPAPHHHCCPRRPECRLLPRPPDRRRSGFVCGLRKTTVDDDD
eukprot:4059106-Pyramimonas_sp.AAC.1